MSKNPVNNVDDIDFGSFDVVNKKVNKNKIHVRIQQRSGKHHITIIENLSQETDFPTLLKNLKRKLNCTGSLIKDKNNEDEFIVQLTGDQRDKVKDILCSLDICTEDSIQVHGY